MDRLPDRVVDKHPELVAQVEPTLLEQARTVDPDQLAMLAAESSPAWTRTGAGLGARPRTAPRGNPHPVAGRVRPSAGPAHRRGSRGVDHGSRQLSRPVPADDGEPDTRTPGQRRHDALLNAGRRLLRSGSLPDAGGTPATVLLTMAVDELEARTGLVTTSHGGSLSIPAALRLAADAQILPAVLDSRGAVLHLGRARRIASPAQRHALAARDRGCSFPARKVTELSV